MALETALEALIDYRGKSPPKSVSGTPVISAKVVKGGQILRPIKQTIDPDYYHVWMRRGYPKAGDVVLTTEGPLGEVAQLDTETCNFAIGQRVVVLRGKAEILDNGFLKYLLISPDQQRILASFGTGTTVEGISQKSLRSVPITLPSYEEQRAIAHILGTLDDKIELNRRMSATLEEMARALFKSWFVDFDPVRAKAGDRPTGLPPKIDALFPDSFQETSLGEIPAGWEVSELGSIAEIIGNCSGGPIMLRVRSRRHRRNRQLKM
jgi:type I restriction enzyme S subunit